MKNYNPTHPSTTKFAKRGLFKGVKNLKEAESKIQKLSNSTEDGDALEIVAEWYFRVIKKVSEYYTSHNIPTSLRKKFAFTLGVKDGGVDALFKGESGEWVALQVKHRGEKTDTLTKTDLNSFFSEAEEVDQRCVFTTQSKISLRLSNKRRYYTVRKHDLESLTEGQWLTLHPWMERKAIKSPKELEVRDYQTEAVDNICSTLQEGDRCQAIMACATGKTIIGINSLKCMEAVSAVLFFPSLALLRQTQKEMMKYYFESDMQFISVCSDFAITKGIDELNFNSCDSEFPVTTSVNDLKRLMRGAKKLIIFSTYQSSDVVAKACKGKKFDMAIFDEAHKTAGRRDRKFSLALLDSNIKIDKRLFLTATPRDIPGGNEGEYASMDDVSTYGPVGHSLPFSEAIDREIITPYKVIAPVITSQEVDRELMKRGEVRVEGDYVRCVHVAHQLALKKAIKKHGIKKIFSFHNSIDAARAFVSDGPEGIGSHVKGLKCLHVNGGQRSDEREDTLNEFRDAKLAILSNARCLTEGVDVPEVDCVAFIQPRKSTIDIVQAVGRAMRNSKGKKFGYLFVPIYVEQEESESTEQAVERTGYTRLVEVIRAMVQHDDSLQELLRTAAVQMRQGRLLGSTQRAFEDKVDILNESVLIGVLQESISLRLIRDLIPTWDEKYAELVAIYEKEGYVRYVKDKLLNSFLLRTRRLYSAGLLSSKKVKLLEQINFSWNPADDIWNDRYKEVKELYKKLGHFSFGRKEHKGLTMWLTSQRAKKREGKLDSDRISKLNLINFDWEPLSTASKSWYENYEALKKFYEKNGHSYSSKHKNKIIGGLNIGGWSDNLRMAFKGALNRKLTEEQIKLLDEIEFVWDKKELDWNFMFAKLQASNGLINDTAKNFKNPNRILEELSSAQSLEIWVRHQRKAHQMGNLEKDRFDKLNSLKGWSWDDDLERLWKRNMSALTVWYNKFGHSNPSRWGKQDGEASLYYFVASLRGRYKKNGNSTSFLTESRVKELEAVEFSYTNDTLNKKWEDNYQKLVAYYEENGDSRVLRRAGQPTHLKELNNWCNSQRTRRVKGQISADQIKKLDKLEFMWNVDASIWDQYYAELFVFKTKHGHFNVQRKDNKSLYQWISNQRTDKKTGRLKKEKLKLLEAINFPWNHDMNQKKKLQYGEEVKKSWLDNYDLLIAYEKAHGHCLVPDKTKLGAWVGRVRAEKAKGVLSYSKIEKLDLIGFDWNPKETRWNKMFQELKAFARMYGHFNVDKKDNKELYTWCSVQRSGKSTRKNKERVDKLNSIGFIWNLKEEAAKESKDNFWVRYKLLKEYAELNGHCNVRRKEDWALASFVYQMRQAYRGNKGRLNGQKSSLKKYQIEALEKIGFSWNPSEERWDKMFDLAEEFYKANGHSDIPASYIANGDIFDTIDSTSEKLGQWVHNQRQFRKKKKLSEEKITKLNKINFVWEVGTGKWTR